jgi:hypothetical protein
LLFDETQMDTDSSNEIVFTKDDYKVIISDLTLSDQDRNVLLDICLLRQAQGYEGILPEVVLTDALQVERDLQESNFPNGTSPLEDDEDEE